MSAVRDEKVVDEKVAHTPPSDKQSFQDEKAGHHHGAAHADIAELEADIQALGADIEEAIAAAENLSEEDVLQAVKDIITTHDKDPNFPSRVLAMAHRYLEDETLRSDPAEYDKLYQELKVEAAMIIINSPYAEVRAVVDNHDDPSLSASTFRAWIIGTVFVAAGSFINQFFSIRYPAIGVGSNVAQLLAYPAGKFFEKVLPDWTVNTFGYKWSINPGPFNMKEHMVITIMANVGFGAPYTNYVVFVQYIPRFFDMPWAKSFGYQILIGLSTNFIGYGLAGLTRRFLVYPPQAIWPANLATIALNRAFHSGRNDVANGWRISRMRWFMYCFTAMFVYFWFPGWIFQAMSFFNWIVWIDPTNAKLAIITGSYPGSGMGLNPLPTFDWNQLAIDPLINPFFTTANWVAGVFITLPIIVAMYFNNVWYTAHLPINTNYIFDNTAKRYNVSRTINKETGIFDHDAFIKYSPAYLGAANIFIYGIFFAVYAATISHAVLFHRHEIVGGFRSLLSRQSLHLIHKDVHSRLQQVYPEVPEWWYFIVLVISIATGAAGVGAWPTSTTPAVVLYGVFLAMIFCIPIGIILSVTNNAITLNVLAEFLGGLWFPGNANAMNFFKSYGYVTTAHTLNFAQDLKLAHYTHIAPRVTFFAQMIPTFVSTFVSVAIVNFQMDIPDVCEPDQKDHFICPGINTFFTASVLWGTLGPKRMFGIGAIYNGLLYCFLIGALLPPMFYYAAKKFKFMKHVHLPVLLSGGLLWAPSNLANAWPALPIAYIFNVYIKRRFLPWWSKYNYITTTGFSCAIAIAGLVIYFALDFHGIGLDWIGNNKPFVDNCDANRCPLLPIPKGSTFGPVVGEFT